MGEVWIKEAEDLNPSGGSGTMSGQGGPRVTLHCTVSNPGSFNAMHDVLTSKKAEPHLLYDYKTDRLGQYFALDKSARALMSGSHSVSHNKMGTVNIQIEVCAQPVDWTADDDWHPGPNFRAMLRAIRSWGIADKFVTRLATSGSDNVRRSWDTFDSSSTGGAMWWGHCHVPSPESHWDPGPLNLDRFFAAAAGTPSTPTGEAMPGLIQHKGHNPVYVSDGIQRRWVQTREELESMQKFYREHGMDDDVHVVANLAGAGVLVGPDPYAPGSTYSEDRDRPPIWDRDDTDNDDEPGRLPGHD